MKEQELPKERLYPCLKCPTMRTKAEGGTTFSICDECWEKEYGKPEPTTEQKLESIKAQLTAMTAERDEAIEHFMCRGKTIVELVTENKTLKTRIAELEKTSYLPMIPDGDACIGCPFLHTYEGENDAYCEHPSVDDYLGNEPAKKHKACPKPAQEETE